MATLVTNICLVDLVRNNKNEDIVTWSNSTGHSEVNTGSFSGIHDRKEDWNSERSKPTGKYKYRKRSNFYLKH